MTPAEAASVRVGSSRARWTIRCMVVVGFAAAIRGAIIAVWGIERGTGLVATALMIVTCVEDIAQWTTAVIYLRWLHRAVASAKLLGANVPYSPAEAVAAHLIPFLNLKRPYDVMEALHRWSNPTRVREVPRVVARTAIGYRDAGRQIESGPRWDHPAPIGAWWLFYITQGAVYATAWVSLGEEAAVVGQTPLYVLSAVLGILVIRSVDARQQELRRRLEAAADERTGEPPPPAPAIA